MIVLYLLLSATLSVYAVTPENGQNLWQLVSTIGCATDLISSFDTIDSDFATIASQADLLDTQLSSFSDQIGSQQDNLDKAIASVEDFLAVDISILDSDVISISDVLTTKISVVDPILISIGDALQSYVDILRNDVGALQTLLISELDSFNSDMESIEDTIGSQLDGVDKEIKNLGDVVISALEIFESNLDSAVEQFDECALGVAITQTQVPFIINNPGVYTVCGDLTLTTGISPVITIAASQVTLNIGGHTISTGDSNYGIAIGADGGVSDITVYNGSIAVGASTDVAAVIMLLSQNVNIEDIKVQNGPDAQITIGTNCNNIVLKRCICSGTNGNTIGGTSATGAFYIDGLYSFPGGPSGSTSNIVIEDCIAENGVLRGFACNNAQNVLCINTTVYDAVSAGFRIDTNASSITLTNCAAVNSCVGFNILNSTSSLSHCSGINNSGSGFASTPESAAAFFVECNAYDNGTGFSIFGSNGLLKRCIVSQNITGIFVDVGANNTQILDTCPANNTTNFTNNSSSTTFVNLGTVYETLSSAIEAIETCCSEVELYDAAVTSAVDLLQRVSEQAASGLDSFVTCSVGTAITQSMIPYTIIVPGMYVLCEDVTASGAPAITVGTNNVSLNLNNYTITNNNNAGIFCNGQSNISINNGTIYAALEALVINNSSQISINNIRTFNTAQIAINISNSSNIIIDDCLCDGTNGNSLSLANPAAIFLFKSSGVVVKNSVVTNGFTNGFLVQDIVGSQIEISFCSAYNTTNAGFYVYGDMTVLSHFGGVVVHDCIADSGFFGFVVEQVSADESGDYTPQGPTFDRCIAANNTSAGFFLGNILSTLFSDCVSSNNNVGFDLNGTISTYFNNCVAHANRADGFLNLGEISTTFKECTATSNRANGFNILSLCSNMLLDNCLASNNVDSGINSPSSSTIIVDTRSSNSATIINPAYSLNGAVDSLNGGTVITIS